MATMDLRKLSVKDLESLIARAEKVLANKRKQQERALLRDFKEKAEKLGLDFDQVVRKGPAFKKRKAPAKAKRKPVKPKYSNPKNPKETWSGKGWPPAWAKPYKEKGTLDKIRIKE